MCVRHTSFSVLLLLLNKITAPKFINNPHLKQDPSNLASTEVFNEGVRSKLLSRVFFLFDIRVKEKRSPGNEVA